MAGGSGKLGVTLGGAVLHLVAKVVGVRVTSWWREQLVNDQVGGSPTSNHLVGGAVDVGRETEGWRLSLMSWLAAGGGLHTSGTAPHYHFDGGWSTVGKAAGAVLLAWKVLR